MAERAQQVSGEQQQYARREIHREHREHVLPGDRQLERAPPAPGARAHQWFVDRGRRRIGDVRWGVDSHRLVYHHRFEAFRDGFHRARSLGGQPLGADYVLYQPRPTGCSWTDPCHFS